jgi:hypothetical protein
MQTGMPVGSQVERNTYDSIAGLLDPQVLTDVFGVAFPSTLEDELPTDTSPSNRMSALPCDGFRFTDLFTLKHLRLWMADEFRGRYRATS